MEILDSLGRGTEYQISLAEDGHVAFRGLTNLHLAAGDDLGITQDHGGAFIWTLSKARWRMVSSYVEPFEEISDRRDRFQWLAGRLADVNLGFGETSVLITESLQGEW
jgi:hypothetical protein